MCVSADEETSIAQCLDLIGAGVSARVPDPKPGQRVADVVPVGVVSLCVVAAELRVWSSASASACSSPAVMVPWTFAMMAWHSHGPV